LNSQQRDYQQKIHGSANYLLRLIDDILDFSKIEAGKIDMEHRDFSLDEVLEYLASVMHVKSAEKGLKFSLEGAEKIQTHHLAEALQYRSRVLDL
jgi:polar amino acid transport system substrate-binding protein/two-component system sensor histidine kinase/response regulator